MATKKFRIVIISDWYSENMGYAENFLPKAMAALGHDVHVVTSTAQVYYKSSTYRKTYQPFLGPSIVPSGVKQIDGYTLHRLPVVPNIVFSAPGIEGLTEYLSALDPQIVQTFEILSPSTYQAAKYCKTSNCKLFLESHTHASVFDSKNDGFGLNGLKSAGKRLRSRFYASRLKFIDSVAQKCYPIALDVAKIAVSHFRVSADKLKIQSLGVDTNLFYPADSTFGTQDRDLLRAEIGLGKTTMVCIYTGRFSRDKKPQCLARAINYLQHQGEDVQGLFVGNGAKDELDEISSMKGCFVHQFVPVVELRKFYWISDIGVWPSQESTSQLDAAACGLPLILSNRIEVMERIDGNGLLYEEEDEIDLAMKIKLLQDQKLRREMAKRGVSNVRSRFSWDFIARERLEDYAKALGTAP